MKFVAGKSTRFRLSNEQWNEVRKAGGLPTKARTRIEAALASYIEHRIFFERHLRTRPQRERLRRVTKLADDLLTALVGKDTDIRTNLHRIAKRSLQGPMPSLDPLKKIFGRVYSNEVEIVIALARELERGNPDGERSESPAPKPERETWPPRNEPPLTLYLGTSTPNGIQLLYQIFLSIERLRLWAEAVHRAMPRVSKEGTRRRVLSDGTLINALDEILFAYTGELMSRSYKKAHLRRYVELCFRAVDSNIGSGSIDKAIQAHVRERLHATKSLEDLSGRVVDPLPMTELLALAMSEPALQPDKLQPRVTRLRNGKRS